MPLDYSKWDHIEVSDSDDDPRPRVIKLDGSERVELNHDGYNIVSDTRSVTRPVNLAELSNFWKKHVNNGMAYGRSHIFSQDRYDVCILIAVGAAGKSRFEVKVTESSLAISRGGSEIFNKELFAKVNTDDEMMNWQIVRKNIDWKALEQYCSSQRQCGDNINIEFTEFYEETFIEVDLKKHNDIADCFIWWPKAFKVCFFLLESCSALTWTQAPAFYGLVTMASH